MEIISITITGNDVIVNYPDGLMVVYDRNSEGKIMRYIKCGGLNEKK